MSERERHATEILKQVKERDKLHRQLDYERDVVRALSDDNGRLQARIDEVRKYWRDWPQSRRDGVRALSTFVHDAIENLLSDPASPPAAEPEWTPSAQQPSCFRCGGTVWNVEGTTQRIDGKLRTVHIRCSRLRPAPTAGEA
jgi:hypothetical protein